MPRDACHESKLQRRLMEEKIAWNEEEMLKISYGNGCSIPHTSHHLLENRCNTFSYFPVQVNVVLWFYWLVLPLCSVSDSLKIEYLVRLSIRISIRNTQVIGLRVFGIFAEA